MVGRERLLRDEVSAVDFDLAVWINKRVRVRVVPGVLNLSDNHLLIMYTFSVITGHAYLGDQTADK